VLQLGNALTTATASEEHMVDDVAAWGAGAAQLTDAEMGRISALSVAPDDPVKAMCRFK